MSADYETTQYGFKWGGVQVTRIASAVRGKGRKPNVYIGIGKRSDHSHGPYMLEVYVSPTGRSIRVFRGRKELK